MPPTMTEPDMIGLLDFREKFDACLAEVGHRPPHTMYLKATGELTIIDWPDEEWRAAATQALRLTAPTFEPAARLLAVFNDRNADYG